MANQGRPRNSLTGRHYFESGIAKARIKAGFTGAQMCEALGLKGNQATKLERGQVALTAHDAVILCGLFGVSITDLLQGVPKKPRGRTSLIKTTTE